MVVLRDARNQFMSNPYQSYQNVAATVPVSHRALEATALMNMSRDLERVVRNWSEMASDLDPILEKNRMLWVFLATEAGDNPNLPDEVKQNFLNLSIFVLKRTMTMVGQPSPQGLAALININRTIAEGLSRGPEAE